MCVGVGRTLLTNDPAEVTATATELDCIVFVEMCDLPVQWMWSHCHGKSSMPVLSVELLYDIIPKAIRTSPNFLRIALGGFAQTRRSISESTCCTMFCSGGWPCRVMAVPLSYA